MIASIPSINKVSLIDGFSSGDAIFFHNSNASCMMNKPNLHTAKTNRERTNKYGVDNSKSSSRTINKTSSKSPNSDFENISVIMIRKR